ncbi:MAG: hypothetical protein GY804_06960 [Alphaproteobacteria bacterium]|nr:hypothetical protein [Alphaproteobacteria bacterium]
MTKELKLFLLKTALKALFFKDIYVASKNKSTVCISLLVVHQGRLLLVKDNDQYSIINTKINVEEKKDIIECVKNLLSKNVFKRGSMVKNIQILDSYRSVSDVGQASKQIKDELFFKIELENLIEDNLLSNVKILDLEALKMECFKNKFNVYDYRLFIKAMLNN